MVVFVAKLQQTAINQENETVKVIAKRGKQAQLDDDV
jgi:hypothetical protein